MKLDVDVLRYLSKDDFRVLTAVEMGMRNHEIVPAELIERIACLKHGGTYKVMKNLLKYKLLHHDSSKYDGFRLTYLGYDFLAIKTLVNRGVFSSVGRQIGVGKESDIFEVANEDGTIMAMKLHRLGRTSFRAVKNKRDYLRHRSSFNWLYLSRLAALKEFAFMKALGEHGFPVPTAVDCNRHCVIMSMVQGYPLVQVKEIQNPDTVFENIIGLVIRLAEHGLIHCDFNEFNIMIDDDEKVTMIDFPQMVSVSHRNAQMYFDRDVECIFKFFRKRFNKHFEEAEVNYDRSEADGRLSFSSIVRESESGSLDKELAASGFTQKDQNDIQRFLEGELDDEEGSESDNEGTADDEKMVGHQSHAELNTEGIGSLTLCSRIPESGDQNSEEVPSSLEPVACNKDDEEEEDEDESSAAEDDPELAKSLSKERRRSMLKAKGRHKAVSSRNSYKDKGGKSQKAKIQKKQLSSW